MNNSSNNSKFITVVSGLPRSGTSMMMKMLEAGGMDIVTDKIRLPDEDNPNGYYEYEQVKALKNGNSQWISSLEGKAVKIISALLEFLPPDHEYRVIFMERNMQEILASQRQMLLRRGEPAEKVNDETMGQLFLKHLNQVNLLLARRVDMFSLNVNYNRLISEPQTEVERVLQFLDLDLDKDAMISVPDHGLYRQRK